MNDLIRRTDVLETYADLYWADERINVFKNDLDKVFEDLRSLPSAEPEIIRCKDCKNYYPDEDGRGYHCERDSNVRFSVHKDFYCADAERRTDE